MTVKKYYQIGDTVWIYGINRSNVKPVQGTVIKAIDLSGAGYTYEHYIIEIPTHIEPILEIRTWHNISQDEKGPVGSLRNIGNIESTIKFAGTVGFAFDDNPELDSDPEDEISTEQIHAALEQTQRNSSHQPLILKDVKKPRRKFVKRKPNND
jgi:hypothetical protein